MYEGEVTKKLDFLIRAYQNLIDNQVSEGEIIGPGVKGTWKADKPLTEFCQNIIEALMLAKLNIKQHQMLKLNYNARLKADMAAMLTEIQLEIEELKNEPACCQHYKRGIDYSSKVIQEHINALKGGEDGTTAL